MGRTKQTSVMDEELNKAEAEKLPIEEMPLNSVRDYRLYNEEASKINKRLRICKYPLKPCPVELHPTQRVVFGRNDQPSNPLAVYISNSIIHYENTLIPGKTYDLPTYVVSYLSEKGNPIWSYRTLPDGSKETFLSHMEPRFAIRTIYTEQ